MLQGMGRLNIHVTMPRVQLEIGMPQLRLEQSPPQIQIDIDTPAVHIDQTAPKEEIGLKGSGALGQTVRDNARGKVIDAIGMIAREGDRARDIHRGVTVSDIVADRTTPAIPEVTVAALPSTRPRIEATGGLKIGLDEGSVRGHTDLGRVEVDVDLGEVTVTLAGVRHKGAAVDLRA